MSIFQKLFNLKEKQSNLPQGEPLPSVTINFSRRSYNSQNESEIYQIYKQSGLIQQCVNIWLNEIGSAPMKPYIGKNVFERGGHLDLFSVDFIQNLMFQILMSGTGFIYKIRNDNGNLVNVQVLNGFHVSKNYENSEFVSWNYSTAKGQFTIAKEDIVAIPWFTKSTDDENFGLSPISAITEQAKEINELQRFVTDMAESDFVPRTILSAPVNTNLTPNQQKQILDQVRSEFQNNPGSIKVLNGGWTIERLSLGLNEIDTTALRIVPETDICGAFQISPILLNTVAGMQNSTYSNLSESRKFFIQNVIAGMWSKIEQIINDHFSYEFPSQPTWHFEVSNLPSMQEDVNAKFARLNQMYISNSISRAELRAELGLEDIDNGQQVFYQDLVAQAGFGALNFAEDEQPTEVASAEKPKTKRVYKKKIKGLTYPSNDVETKAQFWRRYNTITTRNSKDFTSIVNRMIDDMKDRTLTSIRLNSTFIADGNLKREDFQAYNESILKAQENVRRRLANDLGFAFDDISPDAQTQIRELMERTSDELFLSMEKMISDTEQELSKSRSDLLEDKIDLIDKKFEKFKNVNAPAIADYSANNVTAGVQEVVFKDKEIKYIWLTQRDGRVRASHRAADGQEPDESGFFTLGDGERTKRPCAPGMTAKNSMRCRCILYPVEG